MELSEYELGISGTASLQPPRERPTHMLPWRPVGEAAAAVAARANASSLDEIWRLKRHTDRSPNSLRGDSWASLPNATRAT